MPSSIAKPVAIGMNPVAMLQNSRPNSTMLRRRTESPIRPNMKAHTA